jgi:hypothetical protein
MQTNQDQPTKLVTAKELNQFIYRRNLEKNVTFREILDLCMKKIKKCAYNRQYRCVYEVPEFILGSPLFDVNDAIRYVIDALKNECGMYVRYFFPKLIYVSWDMDEVSGRLVMTPHPAGQAPNTQQRLHAPQEPQRDSQTAPPMNPYLMGGGFLPPPAITRDGVQATQATQQIPARSAPKKKTAPQKPKQVRPITDFKPNGKFVMNI